MKAIFICLIIIFSSYYVQGQKIKATNKSATNIYKNHLSVIGEHINFLKQKDNFTYHFPPGFDDSTIFLEKLTLIYCDIFHSFEGIGEPSRENYKDWKAWYKLNKKNLYLDSSKVKIKGKVISLVKRPIRYYKKNLKLIKKSIKRKLFKDPEYSDAIYFLRDLTGIERSNSQEKIDIPLQKEIVLFEKWLKENKSDLFWDVKSHNVKLNNSD